MSRHTTEPRSASLFTWVTCTYSNFSIVGDMAHTSGTPAVPSFSRSLCRLQKKSLELVTHRTANFCTTHSEMKCGRRKREGNSCLSKKVSVGAKFRFLNGVCSMSAAWCIFLKSRSNAVSELIEVCTQNQPFKVTVPQRGKRNLYVEQNGLQIRWGTHLKATRSSSPS